MASHHPIIDPILPELRSALADLAPAAADHPDDHHHRRSDRPHPGVRCRYWAANLRNPVRFSQAIATAGADHHTFIEISPHPLLTHAITDTLESTKPTGTAVHIGDEPRPRPNAVLSYAARRGRAGGARRHRKVASPTSRHTVAPFDLLGCRSDRPCGIRVNTHPLLGVHIGIAVRPRPCLAGGCRNRRVPVARRPQGARPTHHAGRGLRRDRAGGRQRSAWPAR